MPTINAGASARIDLLPGYKLRLNGIGSMVRGARNFAPLQYFGPRVIGPFNDVQTFYISATTATIYSAPSDAVYNGMAPCGISGAVLNGVTAAIEVATGYNITAGQWANSGSNIAGATGLTYALTSGDYGVPLTFTATGIPFTTPSVSVAAPVQAPSIAVPFSTTQAFSSGTRVIYADAIYQFTSNRAAGNWTGNDVTYIGQNGTVPLNTVGFSKPFGVVAQWTAGAISTTAVASPVNTRGGKFQMEAPFTKLRATIYQRNPQPIRGLAISVASTETDAVDTISNGVDPIVGGTAHSVLRNVDQYGFLIMTWNSGATQRSPVQAPGAVSAPGFNYITNLSTRNSDWADCNSVPVVSGNRPMVVTRQNRVVNVGDASSNLTTSPSSPMATYYNRYKAGNSTGRLYYFPLVCTDADQVANPTLSKATASPYDPTVATSGIWQDMAWAAQHTVPTRNFFGFGDSITEGYNWWQDAVYALSTLAAPCYVANFGCSTNKPYQYLALLRAQIREDNYMTDIIIPSFGQNMDTAEVTDAYATAAIAELQEIIALAATFKKRIYIWTAYSQYTNKFAGFPVCVAAIARINQWVRDNNGNGYKMADVAIGWNNATMQTDGTHPNAGVGQPYMNSVINPVIQLG